MATYVGAGLGACVGGVFGGVISYADADRGKLCDSEKTECVVSGVAAGALTVGVLGAGGGLAIDRVIHAVGMRPLKVIGLAIGVGVVASGIMRPYKNKQSL